MSSPIQTLAIHLHFRTEKCSTLKVEQVKQWVGALEKYGLHVHHFSTEDSSLSLSEIEWKNLRMQGLLSEDGRTFLPWEIEADWRHYQWLKGYHSHDPTKRVEGILIINLQRPDACSPKWLASELAQHLRQAESSTLIEICSEEDDFGGNRRSSVSAGLGYYVAHSFVESLLKHMLPLGQVRSELAEGEMKLKLPQVVRLGRASLLEKEVHSALQEDPILKWSKTYPMAFATCYFNPCKFVQRYFNTLRFLRQPYLPNLVVVELAFGEEPWQLPDDTPNLIRVRSSSILWQKEALLNIGLKYCNRHSKHLKLRLDGFALGLLGCFVSDFAAKLRE